MVTFKDNLMRNITILFLTISLYASGQQSSKDISQKELIKYIQMPDDKDVMCIQDIERAKTDVKNGRLVFCMPISMGGGTLRQEKTTYTIMQKEQYRFSL